MEIKCIKKEKVVEYPKMNEINNNKLKRFIPDKWMKLGITSLIFEIVQKNSVFASTMGQMIGGTTTTTDSYSSSSSKMKEMTSAYMNHGIIGATIIFFVIGIIGVIVTRAKLNQNEEDNKVRRLYKLFKILSIISILFFIIWQIIYALKK